MKRLSKVFVHPTSSTIYFAMFWAVMTGTWFVISREISDTLFDFPVMMSSESFDAIRRDPTNWLFSLFFGRPYLALCLGVFFGFLYQYYLLRFEPEQRLNHAIRLEYELAGVPPWRIPRDAKTPMQHPVAGWLIVFLLFLVSPALFGYSFKVSVYAGLVVTFILYAAESRHVWETTVKRAKAGYIENVTTKDIRRVTMQRYIATVVMAMITIGAFAFVVWALGTFPE